jgi:hypothetical protein
MKRNTFIQNEDGSVMVLALLVLLILTLLGITSTYMTKTETMIAENHYYNKIAFYAADAAKPYVAEQTLLYSSQNIDITKPIEFPNNDGLDNDGDGSTDETGEKYVLSGEQAFEGTVLYRGSGWLDRGLGFEVGSFKAHVYQLESTGYGPRNSVRRIEDGFYRIGF